MMRSLLRLLPLATGMLSACGIGYYILCLWSARNFLRDWKRAPRREHTPPVSILKPLRGADPGMYEAFRSHCLQDYPEYELIFGVAEADDPAVALVERLRQEFPERRIELVLCPQVLGTNLKVSNLVQMLPHARYDYLLVNDSDIRVSSDYLRGILSPFADSKVGMVTSLYRGTPGGTLGSKLEALGISTDFIAGVLAARQLEGVHFALGSTLAFPRRSLDLIGGFEPLLDYLADDFELGNRISAAGFEVVISNVSVDTHLADYDLSGYWAHQLRWARSARDSRKRAYLGVVITFGLPWAMLTLALSHAAPWALALFGVVLAVRLAMALVVGRGVLKDPSLLRDLWLLPLRDVLALAVWVGCYAGHSIAWRGNLFLLKDGKLVPLRSR